MKRIIAAFLTALLFLATGCLGGDRYDKAEPQTPEQQEGYMTITAQQGKEMMDTESSYLLLDVRTREEYQESRIEGAVLMPVDEISDRAQEEIPDKDMIIIVYCRSGARSASAAKLLSGMGYSRVYDMGGIMNWPYDTVSG